MTTDVERSQQSQPPASQQPEAAAHPPRVDSIDHEPWTHPFLTHDHLAAFRAYSESIWAQGEAALEQHGLPSSIAFTVNMAQNMHNWARLAHEAGAKATLIPHPWDGTALNRPEWEAFDGSFPDIADGPGFLERIGSPELAVPVFQPEMDGSSLRNAHFEFRHGHREPLLRFLAEHPGVRHEPYFERIDLSIYFEWARYMAGFDVIYAASSPIAAYLSRRPYCMFSVGGDLQYDCGRGDGYGEVMALGFNAARFIFASNPHTLGHCRRLGLTNAVYLPYPIDDRRYAPGEPAHRENWKEQFGGEVFVLVASRLDANIKGFGPEFFDQLGRLAKARPELRILFLGWGNDRDAAAERIRSAGLDRQIFVLEPVGKKRLIDYYRSCDIVLDQLRFGYYGAAALEAAACGKPVVMRLRQEHYDPLYAGDPAPFANVRDVSDLAATLTPLIEDAKARADLGAVCRSWIERTHGRDVTVPRLLGLLTLAAREIPLSNAAENPLLQSLSQHELAHHERCRIHADSA